MKKILLLLFILLASLAVLTSCGCKHEFAPATCESPAICIKCNEPNGIAGGHSFNPASCENPRTCVYCGKTEGEADGHSFTKATCQAPKTCTICGKTEGERGSHKWKRENCLTPIVCEICNLTDDTKLGHDWTTTLCNWDKQCKTCGETEKAKEHTWNTNECQKLRTCIECGFVGGKLEHNWIKATCVSAESCTQCGQTNGKELGHDWKITSCAVPKVCQRCNEASTEDLPHRWIFNGCEEKRECIICSQKEANIYGHRWQEATCYDAKRCEECDKIEGEPLGHDWKNATCALPKTCTRCNLREGEPSGHSWNLSSVVEPMCEDGKEIYFCYKCSGTSETRLEAKYGYHTCDTNGLCTQCGKEFDLIKMSLESVMIENVHSVAFCGEFISSESNVRIYKPITYGDVGMPVIDIGGSLPTSKGYENTVNFTYESEGLSFDCTAEIKVQGASSAGKPKKNFNIKLFKADGSKNKVELVDGWGKENKYCLKANYIDYSQSRNVVSGKIFGEIVKSRNDELSDTPNGGAIDGFPILVYNNSVYQGLYTLNIPKDNWMFDMKHSDEKNQAIFMTDTWNSAVSFKSISTSGFVLEYASNEDSLIDNNTQWAYDSMLDLIEFVYKNDGEDFKNGIHEYADIDKCIDSMIYTFFICADDNTSKNILWVTLDGKVWFSSMYDMDGTWGMRWNGNIEFNENTMLISSLADGKGLAPERNPSNLNLLWERIYVNYYDRVCQRYWELRQEILTVGNITNHFESFFDAIPDVVRDAEKKKWTGVPSQNINHLEQILDFASKRIEVMDKILVPKE